MCRKKRVIKKRVFLWLCVAIVFMMAGCGLFRTSGDPEALQEADSGANSGSWEEAKTTPYGKYPELVTYTLGQMSGTNRSNLPDGDTYENNAYTRYLKNMLNIQNKNIYMETEDKYNQFINVMVKDQTIPDILVLSERQMLKELVENDLVEDLTDVYENCATDRIKEMYDSYGGQLLEACTFDGQLMAIPETVIDHGPRLLWLRKDWMDALGLEAPETLEDAFEIIEAFVRNRMGAGEGEEPIGLVCDTSLIGTTSSNYSVEPIFELFGAEPQKWIEKDGRIIYGSLTEETRQGLAQLRKLYEDGILDQNFALRTQNNIRDLVVDGRCGAFFGLWWAPNNPLMDQIENDPDAEWEPYYFKSSKTVHTYASFRDNKYVVVRKGYEHPEIVMKIISVLFDYTRYEAKDADEVNGYFALNVDPTARPLVINVDYNEASYTVTRNIRKTLAGEITASSLSAIEQSYYKACRNYIAGKEISKQDWAAYKSRLSAVGLLVDSNYQTPKREYLAETDNEIPQGLKTLEKNTFLQMILGKQPMSYFDTFVEEWYSQGGEELEKRIQIVYESQ
ncbi:extracellular solute-binding protein [Blautia sp. HCP3S3_G3]|uniref:extracellular solute-binding protein n=1 Tax=Blautia sp. HCP3S3_G3 TaxID=3438913 RepID=UPI003F88E5B6